VEPDHTCQWHQYVALCYWSKELLRQQLRRSTNASDPIRRNARAIMPPSGARGSLVHWSVAHSLVAPLQKGVSEE